MTTLFRRSALAVLGAAMVAGVAATTAHARGEASERAYQRWQAQQETTAEQWAAESQKESREDQRAKVSNETFSDAVGRGSPLAGQWGFPGNRAGGR